MGRSRQGGTKCIVHLSLVRRKACLRTRSCVVARIKKTHRGSFSPGGVPGLFGCEGKPTLCRLGICGNSLGICGNSKHLPQGSHGLVDLEMENTLCSLVGPQKQGVVEVGGQIWSDCTASPKGGLIPDSPPLTCGRRAQDACVPLRLAALGAPELDLAFEEGPLCPGALHSIHPDQAISCPKPGRRGSRVCCPTAQLPTHHLGFSQVPAIGADAPPALIMKHFNSSRARV